MMNNIFLLAPTASWILAQLIKFLLKAFKGDYKVRLLYASGGMPSAHSAVVVALATTALLVEGSKSPIFGISAVFALIVMYDSLGVRRLAGEQAHQFNRLVNALQSVKGISLQDSQLRVLKGHKPIEVAAGAALGALIATSFNSSKLSSQFEFLTSSPSRSELVGLTVTMLAIIAIGLTYRFYISLKYRNSKTMAKVAEAVLIATQSCGWPGLLMLFAGSQKVSFLAWRLWPGLALVSFAIWGGVIFQKYYKKIEPALLQESQADRKAKWLNKQQKSR